MVKLGTGTWVLDGSSNYSGGTTVNAGLLDVNSTSGAGVGSVYVNGGAVFGVTAASGVVGNLYLNNGTLAMGANNAFGSGSVVVQTGVIVTLSGDRTLNNTVALGNLTFAGSNNLALGGGLNLAPASVLNANGEGARASVLTVSGGVGFQDAQRGRHADLGRLQQRAQYDLVKYYQ